MEKYHKLEFNFDKFQVGMRFLPLELGYYCVSGYLFCPPLNSKGILNLSVLENAVDCAISFKKSASYSLS